MNKGWRRARGEVVYFLNSDDALFDAQVLERVAQAFEHDPALDLLVGEVMYRHAGQRLVRRSYDHLDTAKLLFEDLCHQAVFARRSVFERIGGFNEAFRINADYDWLIRAFRSGAHVGSLSSPVATFSTGGAHTSDFDRLVAERQAVRLQYLSPLQLHLGLTWRRLANRLRRLSGRGPSGHFPLAPESR